MASDFFLFPDAPTEKQKESGKTEKAFYTAATSGADPIETYRQVKYEFDTQGESSLYNLAQQKWVEEQGKKVPSIIAEISADPSVSSAQKQAIFETYAVTGFISNDLREKYKIQTATRDLALTELDRQAQDIYAVSMERRDIDARNQEAVRLVKEADITISSILKGTAAVGANIILSIPAGVMGALTAIMEKDMAKGTEAIKEIQAYAYNPTDASSQRVIQKIVDIATFLDIPFQWVGNKVLDVTGSPGAATIAYTGSSLVGYIGGAKLVAKGVKKTTAAGTTATANMKAAQLAGVDAVADSSGQVANAFGTTRGEITGDWHLPKIEEKFGTDISPDIRQYLEQRDVDAQGLYDDLQFDPSNINASQHIIDREKVIQTINEVKGPYYQQANSKFVETADKLEGSSLFGRNSTNGYETKHAAEYAKDIVEQAAKDFGDEWNTNEISIVQKDTGYFVKWDWEKEGYKLEELTFGPDAVSARFLGIDASGLARTKLGEWIWPANMRLDPWVTQTAAKAAYRTARAEKLFLDEIRSGILTTKQPKKLKDLLDESNEIQKVFTEREVIAKYPELKTNEAKDLYKSYALANRLTDYTYWFSDRKYRSDLSRDGMEAIYTSDGIKLGHGAKVTPESIVAKKVWDFDSEQGINFNPTKLNDKQLVRLEEHKHTDSGIYEYALIGGKTKLDQVTPGALPRIEGYMPRRNDEFYFVDRYPKQAIINGIEVKDPSKLRSYIRTIGAAATEKEAKLLEARFKQEFPDDVIQWRKDRRDISQSIITDHKVYRQAFEHSKKRGERLPTLNGKARLEDPVLSLSDSIKTTVRLDAWKDYDSDFVSTWMRSYGKFTDGNFPSVLTDISTKGKLLSETEVTEFKNAQRLFEQYTNQQYRRLLGDEVWKYSFYSIADILEKINLPADAVRKMGLKGNQLVRVPKALATHSLLYMFPQRQWLVQPQKYTELATISPTYLKKSIRQAPAIFFGILNRSKLMEKQRPVADFLGAKTAGLPQKEFDAIVDAIHKSGLPQSVDLNMVVHGVFHDANSALVKTLPEKIAAGAKTVLSTPGEIGKLFGYAPAELANQITVWLFAKNRWENLNPGKNWNTLENISKITGEAWDIADAMTTRAAALPYQDGALSLLFQFAAIQHKSFMQLFSSKVLTGGERARLAAARMFWYGVYGVAGSAAIDYLFSNYLPEDTQPEWHKWKRGAYDWISNGIANAMLDEGEVETDLAVSKSLSPMPETLPGYDFYSELLKMVGEGEGSPRFPFTHAIGSIWESMEDAYLMFYATKDDEFKNPQALQKGIMEAFEFASGMNKYMQAQLILDTGTVVTKRGMPLGVQMNYQEAAARMWGGINTYKEEVFYKAYASDKERKTYIKETADKIHTDLMNLSRKLDDTEGKEAFLNYRTRLNNMLNLYNQDLRKELTYAIMDKDRTYMIDLKESLLMNLLKNRKQKNDEYVTEMLNYLEQSKDPQTQEMLRVFRNEGML